jgi:hypothetical protein
MTMFRMIGLAAATALALTLPANAQDVQTPFHQGLNDRQNWENWFAGLTGDYRAGAYFWAGQRSLPQPGSCADLGGDASAGCFAAQARLAPTDARRKTEPTYRLGWNSYEPSSQAPSQTSAVQQPVPTGMQSPSADLPPTPAPPPAEDPALKALLMPPVAGHNGAWDIIAGIAGKGCAMRTQTTSGTRYYSLMIGTDGNQTVAIIVANAPATPTNVRGIITDKGSGEVLMMKPMKRDEKILDGYQFISTTLSLQDTFRLWGIGIDDVIGVHSKHLVNVQAGPVSFDVDIHGAMEAYQNIQSCAGGE